MSKNALPIGLLAVFALITQTAEATNGYFAHGYGARSKAMAGTGVGQVQDAIAAAALNPAGLVNVGNRLDGELELFAPFREYSVSGQGTFDGRHFPLGPGTQESESNFFPVGALGWSYQLDGQQALGLALYGNGGMNTDWRQVGNSSPYCFGQSGVFCGGRAGVDMAQAFIVGTYAHSFANGRFSVGLSPIFAAQTFKARGLGIFGAQGYSSDPASLSDQGRDYSFGAGFRVGGQAELLPGLRLGASYKSRIYMSPFERYRGLFAQQGEFDIPDSFNVGISWDATAAFTANFDVEHIRYSEIKSVGTPLNPLFSGAKLGAGNGPGFGWNDMTIYKFGGQWRQNDRWVWRGGFSYGQQPIEGSEVLFNILAPGVQEWHLTGGFTHALSKADELSFAFMYSPQKTITGANPLDGNQQIELAMTQFSLQLGWSRKF
ncbi:OmpP1/FadL family transporter [Methylomonas koyamae]|uniref:OmpP1/FadL family transporter n=1 Tax=Methylomonas koyamae TaxID=702114 RepID=UPI0028736BA2|nr:outer membrane protein transport protein [Methylomonas koyamae]WNB74415.1 outer membrane protein transport protein [Methylomonas koyamae]